MNSSSKHANPIRFLDFSDQYRQEVMDIFNYYIENSFAAYADTPLPVTFFTRLQAMTDGYPAYVIRYGDQIAGFCFLRAYNPFPTFRACAEITYFIAPEFTGHGIGEAALAKLESEAIKRGINLLLASISSENPGSIRFHEKHGFTHCGRFEKAGRKFDRFFDVIWMQKNLEKPAS
ncbi:MAG TPA: N-acetyltransferase family protein [Bacteroidales bacterium]|nr:N-acetyltransferase family protein [Bacteroidales bacterium]